jgi:hypothetical protein
MSKSLRLQPNNLAETFMNRDAVRQLIREDLGCACPDSIFDDIVVGCPTIFGGSNIRSSVQILVGRRLLVSLVPVNALKDVAKDTRYLLFDGKDIRDRHGLNRHRLVLVGSVTRKLLGELKKEAAGIDDRMHVHLIE